MEDDIGVSLIPVPTANAELTGDLVPSFFKLPDELDKLKDLEGHLINVIVVCAPLKVLVVMVN